MEVGRRKWWIRRRWMEIGWRWRIRRWQQWRLVVMLTTSTSNWREIYLPIIRAYLGCKHRSSLNQFAPTLFALRSSSDRHRKTKKSHNRDIIEKFRISSIRKRKRHNVYTYEILLAISFAISSTRIFVGNSERYRRPPATGHSNLTPCRLGETTSFLKAESPPLFFSQSGKSADIPFTTKSCALIFQFHFLAWFSILLISHLLPPRSLPRIESVRARRPSDI